MQISVSSLTESVISELVLGGAYSSPDAVVEEAVAMLDLKRKIDEGLQDVAAGRVVQHDMESIKQQVISNSSLPKGNN